MRELLANSSTGKSNQQNLGTIKSTNLCTETIKQSIPDETATCNVCHLELLEVVLVAVDEGWEGKGGKVVAFNLKKLLLAFWY